jgi:hypothetical protein
MRTFPAGEVIHVRVDEAGGPTFFTWAGHAHRILSIEDVREPRLDWWSVSGEVHRVYYLVLTEPGLICEIYHDVPHDAWYLAQVLD